MKPGLYSVNIKTRAGVGDGVLHIGEGGRLLGGDQAMYWAGDYREDNGQLTGEIRAQAFASTAGMQLLFGGTNITITFTGSVVNDGADLAVARKDNPQLAGTVRLRFLAA